MDKFSHLSYLSSFWGVLQKECFEHVFVFLLSCSPLLRHLEDTLGFPKDAFRFRPRDRGYRVLTVPPGMRLAPGRIVSLLSLFHVHSRVRGTGVTALGVHSTGGFFYFSSVDGVGTGLWINSRRYCACAGVSVGASCEMGSS